MEWLIVPTNIVPTNTELVALAGEGQRSELALVASGSCSGDWVINTLLSRRTARRWSMPAWLNSRRLIGSPPLVGLLSNVQCAMSVSRH